jgi:hypothetical protein
VIFVQAPVAEFRYQCRIPLMITHFARPQVLEKADQKGIIVVQIFEW